MKQKRGFINSIFGKIKNKIENATAFKLLNSWDTSFSPFSGNQWEIATVRAAVNAFARNAAKLTPRHIRCGDDTFTNAKSEIDRILQYKPNPYMTAFAMYYKIATNYKLTNNAFLYPAWEGSKLTAMYPIMAQQINLIEYRGEMYCEFSFASGKSHILPYSDIIHIRNYFYDNDIFGSNNRALSPILETAHTFNQSMSKFAELIAVVRGILKVSTAVKGEDLNKRRNDFVRDNLKIENNGSGIVVTDSKYDYEPITDKSIPIPKGQLEFIKNEIYDYFGVNEKIVQNKFSAEEWSAFYEGEIEPFAIQLGQAMTNCLFSERERGFGNEILIEANRLQYASTSTKISAAQFLTNIGAASLDEVREIFNMVPIGGEEGKRRIQTLNAANVKIVDKYQTGEEDDGKSEKESEAGSN
ncbi:MAG: phage portal protein [Oscillospiraceae bacterium]|nr:phage portal protein [Oscillospiraceae bacterium]